MNQHSRSRSEGSSSMESEPIVRPEIKKPDADPVPVEKEKEETPTNKNEKSEVSHQNSKKASIADAPPTKASFNIAEEQEKFYKSAFQDPCAPSGSGGLNDTLSLNITSNIIVYKPRSESSGWFTEAQEIIGIKGKEQAEGHASGNQDLMGKLGPQAYDKELYDESASEILPPNKYGHNRATSNPFGYGNPQHSQNSIRS